MSRVSGRDSFFAENGWNFERLFGSRANATMIARPTYVEMKPASPAPAMPIFGAPSVAFPKMKITHRAMFSRFITTADTRWTYVLPMPSKNALKAKETAIDVTPRKRHFRYDSAAA